MSQASIAIPFAPRIKDIPENIRPKDKKVLEPIQDFAKAKKKRKKIYAIDLLREIRQNRDTSQQKFSGKLERCIQNVKSDLRQKNNNMSSDKIKSRAIAICRSQLGE